MSTVYIKRLLARAPAVAFLLNLCAPAGALAQVTGITLDPVQVTASRSASPVSDALLSTTVITREDIEASQDVDLVSILRDAGGVEIAQSGGIGSQASVFLRGANSNQTLVMIDGVKINSVESGGAFLQHIMLAQVDHIEIVRGNVSALYGSQAVGGVIQIFTRGAGVGDSAGVEVTAGGDDTANLAVYGGGSVGAPNQRTSAAVTVSTTSGGGFSAIDQAQAPFANPADNNYRNRSISAQLSQTFDTWTVSARLFDSEAHLDYDDPTDYTYLDPSYTGRYVDNFENSSLTTLALAAHWHPNASFDSDLQVGGERDRSDNNSTFAESFDIGSTTSQTDDVVWNNRYMLDAHITFNGGLEFLDQDGHSSAYQQNFTRHVESLFAGAIGNWDAHQLQVNLRSDHYSDFGQAQSGLLAYGYALTAHLKLIATASSAFDAPTFDDLYYPGFSNPHLQPEKSRSLEFGAEYHDTLSQARVALFRTNVHDLIAFNSDFIPENIDEARLAGIELSGDSHLGAVALAGNISLDHPIDVATDQPLARRADRSGNLSATFDSGAIKPYLAVNASGLRLDSNINTGARVTLGGYAVTNLGVRYVVSRALTLGVALDNVFDRRYALVDGYNTPGRVVLVTLSGKLP